MKRFILRKKQAVQIRYCGSLVQQNHGEPLHGHGYTLWNLSDHSYKHIEVPNDYGYFTVDIHGSQILTDLSALPKKTYLRVRCLDAIASEVKAAEALISTLTEILDPSRIRIESETDKKAKEAMVCKDVKLAEVTDVDYQTELIREYLKTKLNLDDTVKLDKILLINRRLNAEIKKDEFARNLKWTPIRFEWDNMFAYGEGNFIDFTQMGGVYGVFGPNTCGKSSLFSAMCFCLFDKWERGFKAIVARNASKDSFRCKFEFSIGGIHYFIEKIGEGTRSGNVRVQVNFWQLVNGEKKDLTDVMRRKTNDVIRDYVGSFEDFILTTYSVQNATKNNINFIDLGNTERKDILVQFMGLNVFDRLYENAYEKGKDLAAKLKPHKEKNYMRELDEAEGNLSITESTIRDTQETMNDLSHQIKEVNDSIVTETGKLIKLDSDVPTDLPSLEQRRTTTQVSFEKLEKQLNLDQGLAVTRFAVMQKLTEEISEIIAEDLVKAHATYNDFRAKLEVERRKHELKKVDIKNKQGKLDKLKIHKYDPNCKFCVENIFVKDARQTETELTKDQTEMDALVAGIQTLEDQLKEWAWVDVAYQNYTKLLNDHSLAKDAYTSLNTKVLLAEKDIEKLSQTLKELDRKIGLYHKNQISVEHNQKVNMTILTFKNALNKLEVNLNNKNKQLLELTGKREVLKKQIQLTTETIKDLIETEEERELYDYYCKAVGRNGIPYQVICHTVPEIQREINSILIQTADFTVEIEADDKNIIPYVVYETKGRWPIEMTSGFERFIASVAIRVALSNVSNLPRTSFLILDEGFGTLDANNLASMHTLFTYLKSHFEFIMVISHLDSLKDMVDKQIEVAQIGNFSKVAFE